MVLQEGVDVLVEGTREVLIQEDAAVVHVRQTHVPWVTDHVHNLQGELYIVAAVLMWSCPSHSVTIWLRFLGMRRTSQLELSGYEGQACVVPHYWNYLATRARQSQDAFLIQENVSRESKRN